ncbi:MAG: tetratricopeptide repeat protein [Candidatus Odinarchaeota archaeon]
MGLERIKQLLEEDKLKQAIQELEKLEKNNLLDERDRLESWVLKTRILNKRGEYDGALASAKRLYDESNRLTGYPLVTIDASIAMAESLWKLGRLDESLQVIIDSEKFISESSQIFPVEANKQLASLINRKGTVYMNKGNLDLALECFQDSLLLWEELDDKHGIGSALNNIALIHNSKGELKLAIEFLEKSLTVKEKLGDKQSISSTLNNLGLIYESMGVLRTALNYHLKALAMRVDLGNKQDMAISLNNIGLVHVSQGSLDLALEFFKKCLSTDEELGNKQDISVSLLNIGLVYQYKGDYEAALKYYERCLDLREETKNELEISQILYYLSTLLIEKDSPENARSYLERLHKISRATGNKIVSQRFRLIEAQMLSTNTKENDQARTIEILREISREEIVDKDMTFSAMTNLCRVLLGKYIRTNDDKTLVELQDQLRKILDMVEKSQLNDIKLSTKLLKAKLELFQIRDTPRKTFEKSCSVFEEISVHARAAGYYGLAKHADEELANLKTLMIVDNLMDLVKDKKTIYHEQQVEGCLTYLKEIELLIRLK